MTDLFNLSNPVFSTYVFYATILALKMLLMAPLTGRQRFAKKAFANKEDGKVPNALDEDVERVRRAHLNDLENFCPFFILGLLYVLTKPTEWIAQTCFRLFCGTRIMHTIFYVFLQKQPHRALAFLVGMMVNVFMAVNILITVY